MWGPCPMKGLCSEHILAWFNLENKEYLCWDKPQVTFCTCLQTGLHQWNSLGIPRVPEPSQGVCKVKTTFIKYQDIICLSLLVSQKRTTKFFRGLYQMIQDIATGWMLEQIWECSWPLLSQLLKEIYKNFVNTN